MHFVDGEGQAAWISEHTEVPLDTVTRVLQLEFEYMVGTRIIDLPDYEFEIFRPEEFAGRSDTVDTEYLAVECEQRLGISRSIAETVLDKETDFLRMRGLVDDSPQ